MKKRKKQNHRAKKASSSWDVGRLLNDEPSPAVSDSETVSPPEIESIPTWKPFDRLPVLKEAYPNNLRFSSFLPGTCRWRGHVNHQGYRYHLQHGMERADGEASGSRGQLVAGLTDHLADFVPYATEQLTEEQESALKRATIFFIKKLMLQQSKFGGQISAASQSNSSSDICRVCRGARSKEDLLTTCGCKGTMGFIHLSCLEHWLAVSDSTKCELCSFQYETVRTPKYSILKSIVLWLQSPGYRRDAREIMLDFLALIVFTPMAFFGTYMALLAAETCCWLQCLFFLLLWADRLLLTTGTIMFPNGRYRRKLLFLIVLLSNYHASRGAFFAREWYSTEETALASPTLTRIVSLGCLGIIIGIDTAYLSWLLLRAQHHARAWHRWRRRNSIVRVILPPSKRKSVKEIVDAFEVPKGSASG